MENSNQSNSEGERYERKFLIADLTLKEIEKIIRHNPLMFSEIFYERGVNNLYLDFEDMETYTDNVAGVSQRLKIRIRWYGKLFGLIKKPTLELKIKNGEIYKKLVFPLKQFLFNKSFSKKFLEKEVFNKSDLPAWLSETLKLTSSSSLNCYKRRYFISNNKSYRITIDRNLTFFNIKNNNNFFRPKLEDKQNIILELKYNKKEDDQIEQVTQHFPFRLTKSSKYVCGVDMLHLYS